MIKHVELALKFGLTKVLNVVQCLGESVDPAAVEPSA